jgi:phosphoglycolate phosphatase
VTASTLIFDLDGTISDPFVGISRSVNYALTSLGYHEVDPETIRPMIGPPLTEIFESLLGRLPATRMGELIYKYRQRYAKTGYAENRIYDDIPRVIAGLAATGFVLGVCTAKRADYARKIVALFALDRYFAFVDGGGTGVSKVAQLTRIVASGIDPAGAIMIGDRAGDIMAAQANNVGSIGVLWGFGAAGELTAAKPDCLVGTPAELLATLV